MLLLYSCWCEPTGISSLLTMVCDPAYGNKSLTFGKDYLLPKPMDQQLITTTVSTAVAKPAIKSGASADTY